MWEVVVFITKPIYAGTLQLETSRVAVVPDNGSISVWLSVQTRLAMFKLLIM